MYIVGKQGEKNLAGNSTGRASGAVYVPAGINRVYCMYKQHKFAVGVDSEFV